MASIQAGDLQSGNILQGALVWVMHTNTDCRMSARQPTGDNMLLSGKLSHLHGVAAGRCGRTSTAPAAAVQKCT